MTLVDQLLVLFSSVLVLAGFVMEGAAVRAYLKTERSMMIPLSIGFMLIVAASIATTVAAFVGEFQDIRLLLVVHNGVAMLGYLFVVYSVVFYDRS